MTPDEEIDQLNSDWNMSLDLMDGYRLRWEDAKKELAALRAELEQARADLEMQRIDREDMQDDADVAEAIDEARSADLVCYVCEKPMRGDQAVTDQDIDNICPACASETIGTLNYANRSLRAGAEGADDYYRARLAKKNATIAALVVACRKLNKFVPHHSLMWVRRMVRSEWNIKANQAGE